MSASKNHKVTIVLSIKAGNLDQAKKFAAKRMQDWFDEDRQAERFLHGSLLSYEVRERKAVAKAA